LQLLEKEDAGKIRPAATAILPTTFGLGKTLGQEEPMWLQKAPFRHHADLEPC
jgi:hypothetical protein